MTPREAKFILRAHRADGRYPPDDPVFAPALAESARSPELAAWLEQEHALDETIANKLEAIPAPTGLRETILAGARASRRPRAWWRQPRWLAAAAALVLAGTVPTLLRFAPAPELSAGAFVHLVVDDFANRPHTHDDTPALATIAHELGSRTTTLTAGFDLSTEKLRAANCATVPLGGRDVYEICFERDGAWFHLYVTRLDRAGAPGDDRRPIFLQQEQVAAASWSDGVHLYSLITRAGPEALAKVV